MWLKIKSSIWLLCKDTEIREKSWVSVISRLNSELAADRVRAIKAENKVWLISVDSKPEQTMYARRI